MSDSSFQHHADFLRLYVEHEPSLRGFVRSLVPTLEDANDVMQEVAMALWKRFGSLDAPENFRRWAFGVARLEALEFLRKKSRDRHVFGEDLLAQLADDAEEMADQFVEERKALDVCLQKLPSDQRSLVEAAYAPGVRMDELATRIGRTAMAVYKSLHRIRMMLTDCTKRELSKEGLA
ncbi:MAG: sigma-70 family RNA polymerase sigma factor [Prosthecobacter sp.]